MGGKGGTISRSMSPSIWTLTEVTLSSWWWSCPPWSCVCPWPLAVVVAAPMAVLGGPACAAPSAAQQSTFPLPEQPPPKPLQQEAPLSGQMGKLGSTFQTCPRKLQGHTPQGRKGGEGANST